MSRHISTWASSMRWSACSKRANWSGSTAPSSVSTYNGVRRRGIRRGEHARPWVHERRQCGADLHDRQMMGEVALERPRLEDEEPLQNQALDPSVVDQEARARATPFRLGAPAGSCCGASDRRTGASAGAAPGSTAGGGRRPRGPACPAASRLGSRTEWELCAKSKSKWLVGKKG